MTRASDTEQLMFQILPVSIRLDHNGPHFCKERPLAQQSDSYHWSPQQAERQEPKLSIRGGYLQRRDWGAGRHGDPPGANTQEMGWAEKAKETRQTEENNTRGQLHPGVSWHALHSLS